MVPAGDPTHDDDHRARRPARRGRPGRRRRQLALDRRPDARRDARPTRASASSTAASPAASGASKNGYALMYGGEADDVAKVQPAFDALKPEGEFGSVHAGKRRRRALLQDGPQRHRVRHHAGLRRGLGAAREGRPRRQRHRGLPLLARGHRHPLLAARPAGRRARRGPRPLARSAATPTTPARAGGPSRPAIDNAVATPGDHRRALRPLRLPPGRQPGDEGDRRDAQPVRRPRGASRTRRPVATQPPSSDRPCTSPT